MGLFGKKHTVVDVAFRALTSPPPEGTRGTYRYLWTLKQPPGVGYRLLVRGGDQKLAPVVVVNTEQTKDIRGLSPVERIVTQAEMNAAVKKADGELLSWFRMARKAAGLPVKGRVATKPPGEHPQIPPADGDAKPDLADAHGRGWYRIWKRAEERGMPDDEAKAYKDLAYRWFAVRDRGRKAD